jgi:hypothetical protein
MKTWLVSVAGLLVAGYFIVAPLFFTATWTPSPMAATTKGRVALTCPADIYSDAYFSYLERADSRMDARVEPQLYGDVSQMQKLASEFEAREHALEGIWFAMTSAPYDELWLGHCERACGPLAYQSVLTQCSADLGGPCRDFAIVIDGVSQCLMTPHADVSR